MLKKIWLKIRLFFHVNVSLYIDEHLWAKILLAVGGCISLYLLLLGIFVGGVALLGSITFDLELSQSTDQIAQIEIIYVDEDDNYSDNEFKNTTVCTVIDREQWDEFLSDLDNVTCRGIGYDAPCLVSGPTIRIIYQDGSFDLLSSRGFFQSSNEKHPYVARTLDTDELLELLTAYGYIKPTS